ncbi:PREDICTED: putative uncharacterized protein DDB_G0271982 isoform X2 [Rhagoletis zephyria]|uniref:putative uncharacterized protein DDB_G0271982 isoform X2 n=1 Tax=Rhagoletis zephyria TaxID=28612 RepID=UPI000811797B|nr:PREDICTED: putative uncharacterized protein DDB_G0271982 isoform X2 [Rhagoletis zephyria]
MSSSRNKFFSGGKLSNKSSRSSGLRILWIPGRHKSHPKGRFDATNKQVVQANAQKKNEVWSLGGSKNQRDLLDSNIFEGPSVSGITSAACALGTVGAEKCATATATPTISISLAEEDGKNTDANSLNVAATSSNSSPAPSTDSTTPLVSTPNSPDTGATSKIIIATTTKTADSMHTSDISMPIKTTLTTVTTTTTAEIMDENRFSILGKDISNNIDVYDLPTPPKNGLNTPPPEGATSELLNASSGTTASTTTTPSPTHPSKQHYGRESSCSPTKKKNHKNENNNHQNDINSIESISDNTKIPSNDLEWIDELLLERNGKEMLNKKKKKKKKISTTKELDQLDGVSSKHNNKDDLDVEDEKVVKCLYYTLMCCECTIS